MRLDRTQAFVRTAPFALYLLMLAIEGQAANFFPGFDARLLYPVKAMLVAAVLALCWRHYIDLHDFKPNLADTGWAIVTGVVVLALWLALDQPWATLGKAGVGYDPHDATGRIQWLLAVFRIAGAALVVPLMEELFWRSFLMRWIDQDHFLLHSPAAVSLRAIAISSLVFGFEHRMWLAGIVAGLAYAILYRRTRHLFYAVIAHGVTNGLLGVWVLTTGKWQLW